MSEHSVQFLSKLLHDERVRRDTRKDTRTLSTYKLSRRNDSPDSITIRESS